MPTNLPASGTSNPASGTRDPASVNPASVNPASGTSHGQVRIAIVSPEILAHIRREFTRKGLDVRIDEPLSVEVRFGARPGARPAPGALGDALRELAGQHTRQRRPGLARYRFGLVRSRPAAVEQSPPPEHDLSAREAQVMDRICQGLSNDDIAGQLHIQPKTVRNHINSIFGKLGAGSRVEAVLTWQQVNTPRNH